MKEIIAGLLALILVGGLVPFNNNITNKYSAYAIGESIEDKEYTEGTYGDLKYKNYGDYIEISGCNPLAKEIEIPSEITNIPVTVIGDSAFYLNNWSEDGYMETLVTKIIIPDSIKIIKRAAFLNCYFLEEITLPKSVEYIGDSAFSSCRSLKNITILNSDCKIFDDHTAYENIMSDEELLNMVQSEYAGYLDYCEAIGEPTNETFEEYLLDLTYDWGMSTITNNGPYTNDYFDEHYAFIGTVYGYENSTAQAYAEKYNRKFVSLGDAPIDEPALPLGDINGDSTVDASDASNVLAVYALVSTGKESELTAEQIAAADVNKDGSIDASDASLILAYYAYISTGGTGTLEEYLNS